jgi:hypothetical protein
VLAGGTALLALAVLVGTFVGSNRPKKAQDDQDVMRRVLELLEAQHELTKQQLAAQTRSSPAVVERAVKGLRATGRVRLRSTARGQVVQQVGQAVETDQAMPVTPEKSPRGRLVRREIIYDEDGREAGEETVYERRDAAARPKTVEAKADVPEPTVIAGRTLSAPPSLPRGTLGQGDRPGWEAFCLDAGESEAQGLRLFLSSSKETASAFRCIVVAPGDRACQAKPTGGQVGRMSVHYPAEFTDAPELTEGEYTFRWFGYIDGKETLLASNRFKVNANRQVYCPGAHRD